MSKYNIQSIKSFSTLVAFFAFWIMTFAYILPTQKIRKKTPNIAWCYDQIWGQKWNFFTQPHLYNDRLVLVVKNASNTVIDSVDVLKELWNKKKENVPFNNKEDVLDHIMFRQTAHLRVAIERATNIAKKDTQTNIPLYKKISTLIENDAYEEKVLCNIEAFGKLILQQKGIVIDSTTQYKILFFTDYIPTFQHQNSKDSCVLEFESQLKKFK